MQRRTFVIQVSQGLAGTALCWTTGCGSILHPERCGQPHSNQIDWKVVALDGLGLILFFVPGVIAFAVDFYTGAIYLPVHECYPAYVPCPDCHPAVTLPPSAPPTVYAPMSGPAGSTPVVTMQQRTAAKPIRFKHVVLDSDELQPQQIERAVSEHVGRPISLADDNVRLSRLPRIDRFAEQLARHHSNRDFGMKVRAFFDRFKRT